MKKELFYFASNITEKKLLDILNSTNIQIFEEVLKRESFIKEKLLNLLDNSYEETSIRTKEDLVLFLKTSLDLDDEVLLMI